MSSSTTFPALDLFIGYTWAWLVSLMALFSGKARQNASLRFRRLAGVFRKKDLPRVGMHCLEKATKLSPWDGEGRMELGELYYEEDRLKDARRCFRWATTLGTKGAAFWLGTTLHRLGELRDAIYYYRYYVSAEGAALDVMYNLGIAFYQLDELEDAIESFKKAEELYPKSASIKENLGRCLIALGRFEEASEKLATAAAEDPTNSEVHRLLGLSKQAVGDMDGAEECYQSAIESDTDHENATARLDLSRLNGYRGDIGRAIELLRDSLSILQQKGPDSDIAIVYWELGWWLYLDGSLDESIAASTAALKVDPNLVPVRFNLALAQLSQGDQKKAREQYELAAAQVTDVGDLKNHGIGDLSDALEKGDLEGADSILALLQERYEVLMRELRSVSGLGAHGSGLPESLDGAD